MSRAASPWAIRLEPRQRYLSYALTAVQRGIAHRRALLFSVLAGVIWATLLFHVWRAVYEGRASWGGFRWEEMRTYLVLSYALNAVLSSSVEQRIAEAVRTGNIALELTKPTNFLLVQLAQSAGTAVVEGVVSAFIAVGMSMLLGGMVPPATGGAGLLFVLSAVLGLGVKFLLSYLTGLLCFWTLNVTGLVWARTSITNFFSGALIPLQFLPAGLGLVAAWAPFQSIIHTPLSVYLGRLDGRELWMALGLQLFWLGVLGVLAHVLWRSSVRALSVQGG